MQIGVTDFKSEVIVDVQGGLEAIMAWNAFGFIAHQSRGPFPSCYILHVTFLHLEEESDCCNNRTHYICLPSEIY